MQDTSFGSTQRSAFQTSGVDGLGLPELESDDSNYRLPVD